MILKHIFFLVLIAHFCHAQPKPYDKKFVDSMSVWLTKTPENEEKVNNLVSLAAMHLLVNPALTIKYAKEAATIAERIKYHNGKISALGQSAFSFALSGEWTKATNDVNEAIPLCEKHNPSAMIYMCNIMVVSYSIKGDYQQALHWAQKAAAHPEFEKQEELGKWPTYMQLGSLHVTLNNLDSAKYYADILQKNIEKYAAIQPDLTRDTYSVLGDLSTKLGEYNKALKYYHSAPNQIGLAHVFHTINQSDSAIYYSKIGLKNSQIHKIPINIQASAKILAEELQSSDPKAANEYLNIYINSKDSLYNIEKLKQGEEIMLNEQKNKYELQKIETASINRMMVIIFLTILCFFSVISFLLWKNNRFKQKANTQLTTTLNDLKSTQAQLIQSEKMASLGELTAGIAHEIQNPLNFVNNFSEVSNELISELKVESSKVESKRDKGLEDELLNDIAQNLEKINHHGKRASDIVKGMLEHSRTSSGKKEPTDINVLAGEYLKLAYQSLRAKDKDFNATLETDFDTNLPKIEIIPQDIGRVLLNLINNAFYAVNERSTKGETGYEPTVSITTQLIANSPTSQQANMLILAIKDNGSGIPDHIKDKIFQPFFTTKPTGQGTGLGLSLAYDIVKAHGGELKVERVGDTGRPAGEAGTEFVVKLPVLA